MSEVLRELVVALSLDSDNFSRNLRTINAQIKEAESTFKLAGAGISNFEKSIKGTEASLSLLSSKQKEQNRAVEQYSKALLQTNQKLTDSFSRQEKMKVSLLYEASACASIPIIRNLEEYYDNDLLYSVRGIFNGSTNYILTRMESENLPFSKVLADAQAKGYVETDPSMDIDGFDAKFKLCIITLHAYGLVTEPESVFNYGIRNISGFDMQYAREKGYKIKLVPWVGKTDESTIASYVMPRFIARDKYLYNVDNEYNGVIAEASFAESQFFYGKGAGGHATGSAVLSDISASSYNYRYEYKKRSQNVVKQYTRDINLQVWFRYRNSADIESAGIRNITESFRGREYNYVTGTVNLQHLYENRKQVTEMDAFLIAL